ncbi:uncharacterized protein LOC102710555 isoform X1 [Oryza brachyantha]|uniref:uncharacterized protein LOC102710555 isoform X1 n=1 Tax=Oryza brachyantha TaxID=4533 RepID=UPI001ADBEC03|nr:uncharacterized protein LOC102710555 isoform X1 [Oryza brachyantha]
MEKLDAEIAETLSLLETMFLPSFFDIMVHLMVHLPTQARLAGPVHYRNMYPVERFLMRLKGYVRTKSHPEGSIAESYVFDESLTFCSRYLEGCETRFSRKRRNGSTEPCTSTHTMPFFCKNMGRELSGKCIVTLDYKTWCQAHRYVLFNYDHIEPYLRHLFNTGDKLSDEPFILASQATQVYYVDDPACNGWSAVIQTKPRDFYDMSNVLLEDLECENEHVDPCLDINGQTDISVDPRDVPPTRLDIDGTLVGSSEKRKKKMAGGEGNKYEEERQERIRRNNEALQKVIAIRRELDNTQEGNPGSGSSDKSKQKRKRTNTTNNMSVQNETGHPNLRPRVTRVSVRSDAEVYDDTEGADTNRGDTCQRHDDQMNNCSIANDELEVDENIGDCSLNGGQAKKKKKEGVTQKSATSIREVLMNH